MFVAPAAGNLSKGFTGWVAPGGFSAPRSSQAVEIASATKQVFVQELWAAQLWLHMYRCAEGPECAGAQGLKANARACRVRNCKNRLDGVMKHVRFVFGLEIKPHLFQMFSVVLVASSYCAALGGIKRIKNCGVPSRRLQTGRSSREVCSLLLP